MEGLSGTEGIRKVEKMRSCKETVTPKEYLDSYSGGGGGCYCLCFGCGKAPWKEAAWAISAGRNGKNRMRDHCWKNIEGKKEKNSMHDTLST